LRFRTRAHLDDAIALDALDRLRAIAQHTAPAPPEPDRERQEAALRAVGFEPTNDHRENFFACRLAGVDPGIVVNVIVGSALVELTAAVPAVGGGMTFHVAADDLMERAVPAWRHDPRYPWVPFGSLRPFEATIGEIAALARDVAAALSRIGR